MAKHFITKTKSPFKNQPVQKFTSIGVNKSEYKTLIEEYTDAFKILKESISNADISLQNIENILKAYNEKVHSSKNFKKVIKKYNEKLRTSLQNININMMLMDNILSKQADEEKEEENIK